MEIKGGEMGRKVEREGGKVGVLFLIKQWALNLQKEPFENMFNV